jgi:hypothetical protein
MSSKFENYMSPSETKEQVSSQKKYQLLYDAPAGAYYVKEWTQEELADWENSGYRTQDDHYREVGLYDSQEELEKAIQELRGPKVFAVFEDQSAGEVYTTPEDNLTGNWRGSREGHANLVAVFENQEEAEKFVEERRAYYERLAAEHSDK